MELLQKPHCAHDPREPRQRPMTAPLLQGADLAGLRVDDAMSRRSRMTRMTVKQTLSMFLLHLPRLAQRIRSQLGAAEPSRIHLRGPAIVSPRPRKRKSRFRLGG